ncbi:hypothetical protein [Bradyrhizobium sp. C9]|nr:hypothetical protein [Bradyrhizobium sp. C9]
MSDIAISAPRRTSLFPAAMISLVAVSLLMLAYWIGALIGQTAGG